ncbi:hypothetical protein MANAM107_09380 [Actinomyces capricornis]|uniref:Lantibiotic ABC transporter permease n=2 Tax=Actinomyces capricornis TaxID=2755559 RepID=A0ABN6K7R9_9ACTO|nr:hypothetical protein MANAM107_09380 [Actinomyces capricornis]
MRRPGLGALIAVEILKLKRSAVWVVTGLLPLLAVITGSANYAMNSGVLSQGWVSLSSQVTLFYSMAFFSLGVALLASAAWRVEHRGTSWSAMRTGVHSAAAVVAAKTLATMLPVAAMQAVLIALTWVVGVGLGLGPAIPAGFVLAGLLAIVVSLPLVALQSLLSMLMRSFAAPVALCFGGCVAGFGMLAGQSPLVYAIPQGIVSRCLSLGSSAVSDAGRLDASGVLPVLVATAALGAVCWGALLIVARRTGGARA